mgnify:CR=1 FL=1
MSKKIAIIGLGYVGLPLAVEFAKKFKVVGFDINQTRLSELNSGLDKTLEIDSENLNSVLNSTGNTGLSLTSVLKDIESFDYYIVTVPTPVDKNNKPDFTPLIKASETVGKVMRQGAIVVYESTVYPGATEEICIPVLEKISGLTYNTDFHAGYSPERINPGDKEHTVTKILKIVSGSTAEITEKIADLYGQVIIAGIYKAASIKVAEAAKVIENTQRDINIAFVNELSKIFNRLDLDTTQVLEAAGTKWNCIGVDPYYLAQKAQEVGYHPEMILAGRRLNDSMGEYIAEEVIKLMIKKDINIKNSNILVLGATFKENCPDVRNTRVVDILNCLATYHTNVTVMDPWVNPDEMHHEYGWRSIKSLDESMRYDAVVLAVAHNEFREINLDTICKKDSVIYDVKGFFPLGRVDQRL